ncbi:MAG: HD domain-containing protein [Clostridia bacterium]|nr:HD domain-containing protein [Clostridia bacterium]
MVSREELLSPYACKSKDAILLREETEDIRPTFYRDIDKIIHSSGYTRYIDKTQVFSFVQNDHITHRVLHVQLVSKIARTIGRSLNLNEDLIEAISLGHDIGHTPFGHKGEELLNKICEKEKIGHFYHNVQSVRVLKDLENLNISVQTLDGILAHNGEMLKNKYEFNKNKTKEELLEDLNKGFEIKDYSKIIKPMTMEACVVRLADVIAYIGRDIEDAISVGVIKRNNIPKDIIEVLGDNNSKIVDTLIRDIILNSVDKPYITFSKDKFEALIALLEWNYKKIYLSEEANKNYDLIEELFQELYYKYIEIIENIDLKSCTESQKDLYEFVNKQENKKRAVIDYIAGQTDNFFIKECELYFNYKYNLDRLRFF